MYLANITNYLSSSLIIFSIRLSLSYTPNPNSTIILLLFGFGGWREDVRGCMARARWGDVRTQDRTEEGGFFDYQTGNHCLLFKEAPFLCSPWAGHPPHRALTMHPRTSSRHHNAFHKTKRIVNTHRYMVKWAYGTECIWSGWMRYEMLTQNINDG